MIDSTAEYCLTVPPLVGGYTEKRIWPCDIYRSHDGTEVRKTLLTDTSPRALKGVAMRITPANNRERERLESILRYAAKVAIDTPLWWSLTHLTANLTGSTTVACDTTNSEFIVGDRVLVLNQNTGEGSVRTITEIHADHLVVNTAITGYLTGHCVLPLINGSPDNIPMMLTVLDNSGSIDISIMELS